MSHTQTQSIHTKLVYVVTGNICTVSGAKHFLFVAKSLSQNWEKSEMIFCFFYIYCIWTEARGMERYLGARENTDALTFKKAASHSRQNHATPHPLCTAHIPWWLQPPSIPVHVRLQTNTHTHIHTHKETHTKCTCAIVLYKIIRMSLFMHIWDPKCKQKDSATTKFQRQDWNLL